MLIIAAVAIVPEIVLLLSRSVFSALGAFVLGVFLVSGLWKKIRGMRDAKDISQKLAGIDIDDVREEMNRLNREKDKLEENISRVKAERYDLTHYHGKDWRILQIDPRDRATLKALEQDLRDVVDAIIHSYDEAFLSNNWLINNIMLYFNSTLGNDNSTLDRYVSVLRQISTDASWPLQLLYVLILGGSINLMSEVLNDGKDNQDWEQSRKSAGVPEPPDEDIAFYTDACIATDKTIEVVAKMLKNSRRS